MSHNLELLVDVARKIRPLLPDFVFVGGAIVELYFTDPVSERVRRTFDTDAICSVTSYTEYHRLGERLRELSFRQSVQDTDPIFRWRSEGHVLDVMPTDPSILGFSNPWYEVALDRKMPVEVAGELVVYPYLDDIVTLVAGWPELPDEVADARSGMRVWIVREDGRFLDSDRVDSVTTRHFLQMDTPSVCRGVVLIMS